MKIPIRFLPLIVFLAVLTNACSPEGKEKPLLIPATAKIDRVNELVRDPRKDSLPEDRHVAEQVVLGFHIVKETRKYAGQYVGDSLSCANCHLNAGQRDRGLPYVGVAAAFPMYRPRSGRIISLEERIRDCFLRSLNGTQPPYDSRELMAVAAYITWLSQGQPVGKPIPWRDKNKIPKEKEIPISRLDVATGGQLFAEKCSTCHGKDGQGVDIGLGAIPGPLWGDHSWNDGAAMARIYVLAGFIRYAMPLLDPGSLTDEQAQNIAAFINSHPRPVYPHKDEDFVGEKMPVDAVYYPQYPKNPLMQ